MARVPQPKTEKIVEALERHFGQEVLKITAPGGKGRGSYRVHFADRSVIVTCRTNLSRARLEAHVLERLGPVSDDVPQLLGCRDTMLFQSDVGETRLSHAVTVADETRQAELAAEAVAALFRIQAAARRTSLMSDLPHLGVKPSWIRAVVNSADVLARRLGQDRPGLDRDGLCERLVQPAAQFVKWDCRSGNAALGADGKLRWFDFEYSGLRHGAEDLAWLIGDEIWPVRPAQMLDIVSDAFDPGTGYRRADYLSYLALFTTFHSVQRLLMILGEVTRRGWSSQERVVRYDRIGAHPLLGLGSAETAAFCADQNEATRPLVPLFEAVSRLFADAMQGSSAKLAG
jgi:hypothetical protein